MGEQELKNLAKIGQLKPEAPTRAEFNGMVSGAKKRLTDAQDLTPESRFDLAYNAAHGLALAALRLKGYRSENRSTAFQALAHTVESLDSVAARIFAKSHNDRNLAEYEGRTEVDERFLAELIRNTITLQKAVLTLKPPSKRAAFRTHAGYQKFRSISKALRISAGRSMQMVLNVSTNPSHDSQTFPYSPIAFR